VCARVTSPLLFAHSRTHHRQWQILLVCRTLSVALNNVNDCDEVFNYWEPLHTLLYGYGFQARLTPARAKDRERERVSERWRER
jgi:hypothetical protein